MVHLNIPHQRENFLFLGSIDRSKTEDFLPWIQSDEVVTIETLGSTQHRAIYCRDENKQSNFRTSQLHLQFRHPVIYDLVLQIVLWEMSSMDGFVDIMLPSPKRTAIPKSDCQFRKGGCRWAFFCIRFDSIEADKQSIRVIYGRSFSGFEGEICEKIYPDMVRRSRRDGIESSVVHMHPGFAIVC